MSYFQNAENVVGATELIKDENKNHFKTAIKAKKGFNKNVEMLGKNETNVFQLCCGQRAYVGYVGWKNLEVTLKWLQGCQETNKK